MDDPLNAFVPQIDCRLSGSPTGPLKNKGFAVKDLFDVDGFPTGAGNPDWARQQSAAKSHAWAVGTLLENGANIVGKTITDELSRGIFGENAHYGTPVNAAAPGCIPGGSSSGSASAVAGGMADIALGTDTGGSVRVPSSFCGLLGMRPTHGRISFEGVVDHAPSFDTVGWFARDATLFETVGRILLKDSTATVSLPDKLLLLEPAFDLADAPVAAEIRRVAWDIALAFQADITTTSLPVGTIDEWFVAQRTWQSRECWRSFGPWIDRTNPRFSYEVAGNFLAAAAVTDEMEADAKVFGAKARDAMSEILTSRTVICLPTTPCVAPPVQQSQTKIAALRQRVIGLTAVAGLLGAPQINLPIAQVGGLPVGLSLIAAPGNDLMLLGVARALEISVDPIYVGERETP